MRSAASLADLAAQRGGRIPSVYHRRCVFLVVCDWGSLPISDQSTTSLHALVFMAPGHVVSVSALILFFGFERLLQCVCFPCDAIGSALHCGFAGRPLIWLAVYLITFSRWNFMIMPK